MSEQQGFEIIEGVKCYSPTTSQEYSNYPSDGFDITDELEDKSFWCRARNRLLKKLILKYCNKHNKTRFLEIGCNTGYFLRGLAAIPNLELVGSEVYLKGLQHAQTNLPQLEFIQLDITSAFNLPEAFDIVGAFDVIEHIEDDEIAIHNICKLLKKDGYFVLSVPQYQFLWSRLDDMVKHKRRYSRADLLKKLQAGGFEIEFVSSFFFVLFPMMLLSRLLDRKKSFANENEKTELEKRVKIPRPLNWLFDKLMRIDELLINCGLTLPFGGSLVVVARKKTNPDK